MNTKSAIAATFLALAMNLSAGVFIDEAKFGESLGGWAKSGGKFAEYGLSGASYKTYRPEITPTPDGGIFISVRIDHVRGWFSSNDHAMLEITVDKKGKPVSAQSSIAIQGRSVTSDVIRGGTDAGQQVAGVDRAVQIGTDLVADISAKMLREKIVEAGRVSFPSALRHNYNLLYQSIRVSEDAPSPAVVEKEVDVPKAMVPEKEAVEPKKETAGPKKETAEPKKEAKAPKSEKLEIKVYGEKDQPKLPVAAE
ncbi:MAG: hypothetical protein ABJQ29_02020 [Luteolibacter sp.]